MIKNLRSHKRKIISVSIILILIVIIFIPFLSQQEKPMKQVNPFPPNISMHIASKDMQRLVGACNETATDIVAKQFINSTVAYIFPSLCNVPTGYLFWVPDVQSWSLLKRLNVA